MVSEGLTLMIYGMGTVFVFLTLLVFCTKLMSSTVSRFSVEEPEDVIVPRITGDATIIAVIEAAIAEHRNNR